MSNRELVINKVKETVELANRKLGINMPMPTVCFDKRGTTAGTAHYQTHTVNFNEELLNRNVHQFIADTCVHEVAHLATFHKYIKDQVSHKWTGRKWVPIIKPHGDEWKRVMMTLGVKPERCHNYDVTEVRQSKNQTTYAYTCGCTTYKLSGTRHSRILKGIKYHCKKCGQTLTRATTKDVPVATVIPKTVSVPPMPREGSKKLRAERLYQEHSSKGREMVIAMFMQELDMTKAGASTYYANCKKAFD